MSLRAGEFPKTVTLQRPIEGNPNSFGHSSVSFVDAFRCAAKVWTRSAGEQGFEPAEFPVGSFRLLLRIPQRGVAVDWGLAYEGKLFRIVDAEERGRDLLVTLELRLA